METTNSKAGMIGLSVGLLIVGLVVGYLLGTSGSSDVAYQTPMPSVSVSPSVSPTASATVSPREWFQYQGSTLSLQYPATLTPLDEKKSGLQTTIDFIYWDQALGSPPRISISTAPNNGGITLEEWYQEQKRKSNWTKIGQTTIGGYVFYQLVLPESDAPTRYIGTVGSSTTVSQGNRTWQKWMIDMSVRLPDNQEQQIFASMKFAQ